MNVEILFESEGCKEIELFAATSGSAASVWLSDFANQKGFDPAEINLFIEDHDKPMDLIGLLVDQEFQGRIHHLHRAKQVEVFVFYQHHHASRHFSPSARLQKVLDWAVGLTAFRIDPVIAPEMELALEGSETPLPKSAHVGRYAHHPQSDAKFTLIRGVIPNGASS